MEIFKVVAQILELYLFHSFLFFSRLRFPHVPQFDITQGISCIDFNHQCEPMRDISLQFSFLRHTKFKHIKSSDYVVNKNNNNLHGQTI